MSQRLGILLKASLRKSLSFRLNIENIETHNQKSSFFNLLHSNFNRMVCSSAIGLNDEVRSLTIETYILFVVVV